ncbi:MAG: ribosomal-processing cysteine protease Prp [Selenomonadaceae bacterium]|nr:ribosomal-processing cysteine protease Prp [Selenomonadaceae bacterium]
MIEVSIFLSQGERISGFRVTGHSGTAAKGRDIVCAGVSALAQAALLGIGEYLHREVEYSVASGKLCMKLKGAPDDLTEAVLQTMLLGLMEIEKLSPRAVRIKRVQEVT